MNSSSGSITGLLGMTVAGGADRRHEHDGVGGVRATREIGLLRAVGLNRPQTRRMIRFEASIISMFGALLGVVLGIFFGWAFVSALNEQGITEFAVPFGQLVIYVVFAGLAGIVAAIPAARATRLA